MDIAEYKSIQQLLRNAGREAHPGNTVITVGNVTIGSGLTVIAGPCAVESREQLLTTAAAVKEAGADMLRGGAFKPRTSPYSFQGMGREGLELLAEARELTGLPVVSEIMDPSQLPWFENIDIIQIGARNMQNYALLKAVGSQRKPVMLKRGLCATYKEWLMSAEYVMAEGNPNVILCERGIRTFENYTRYTPDICAIPVLRGLTHLPILADPSHATGAAALVPPMALAAVAAGADGLLLEVHHAPKEARSDGPQALTPADFAKLRQQVTALKASLEK